MTTEKKKKSLLKRILKFTFRGIGIILFIFIGLSLIPIQQTVKPIKPVPDMQYWTLADGYKIAFTKISGDTSKVNTPIIFLHGGPGGYIHSSIIERMKEIAKLDYDIYLYDQIGSGLSDRLKRPKDYSFGRHVSDLKEIVTKQIKTPKAILIAQSFGALLATHFVSQNPMLVEKIILTSPGPFQPMQLDNDGKMVDLTKIYPKPDTLKFREPKTVWQEVEGMQVTPRVIMASFCSMVFNFKWASDREMRLNKYYGYKIYCWYGLRSKKYFT